MTGRHGAPQGGTAILQPERGETTVVEVEAPQETRRNRPRPTRRFLRKKKTNPAPAPVEPNAAYITKGAKARPNLRKARREAYFERAVPAPSTTRQAEILNPALIAAPTDEEGVVIGRDVLSNSAVAHDPFTAYQRKVITSPSVCVLGVIGSGKSSLIKTVYVLRPIILRGRRAVVMDKKDREGEGEYAELTRQLGNEPFRFRLGGGGTIINPLDPLISEVLGRPGQFGLLRAMAERAAGLDSLGTWQMKALRDAHLAVLRASEQSGRVPLIEDLARELGRVHDPEGRYSPQAAERMHQAGLEVSFLFEGLMSDELGGLFDGPTSKHVQLNEKLTTFDISQLPEDGPANALVQVVAHALVLGRLRGDRGKGTNFVSEEGWALVSGAVARQMNANQMLARGLGLSNIVALHHVAQVGQDSDARSLLREPQTVHIFRQDRAEDIDAVVSMYGLDAGSSAALEHLEQGHHLLKIGRRAEIHVDHVRSPLEEQLTETDSAMLINKGRAA